MKSDLTYHHLSDGFTMFYANTVEGEQAWGELAEYTDGTCKVLSIHAKQVIDKLKAAGYTVSKHKHTMSIDDVMTDIENIFG